MLSAWFRFKYPNVVDGALAASAPIYIPANLTDHYAFFGLVTKVCVCVCVHVCIHPSMHMCVCACVHIVSSQTTFYTCSTCSLSGYKHGAVHAHVYV